MIVQVFVAMAWCVEEQDSPENVLDGCLLAVGTTHEAAYDEIVRMLTEMGDDVERYSVVVRDATK